VNDHRSRGVRFCRRHTFHAALEIQRLEFAASPRRKSTSAGR
jgi:hypothetical protein